MKHKLPIINIFGGPGTGKSTLAAYIFHNLKCRHVEVELVTEYAKEAVWENRGNLLEDQLYITAKQNRKIERLAAHNLSAVVTDSPLILGALYSPVDYYKNFGALVGEIHHSYVHQFNIYIERRVEYNPIGRTQTEIEATNVDIQLKRLLTSHSIFIDHLYDKGTSLEDAVDWEYHNHDLMNEIDLWLDTIKRSQNSNPSV